ncbi:mandelate racemase/muconate lactonizing enzyme family protein [Desulfospira joergensenii]|uniref:mandelate racemase/muconate lactonizing enzyme family protein n=1 Tax=Desulfospira joergensenii TaxID=53329 RepID=UPI0003B5B66D|nr:dipeptide epimerase [Desulfospira joergensenii]
MKIKEIKFWKEDLKLTRPYTIAYETVDAVENIFVTLEGDNGITGIGAGSPAPEVTGETMGKSMKALEGLNPFLKGKDIRMTPSLLRSLQTGLDGTPAAMAAADIALHDLAGKTLGLPLADILGRAHDSLPTSITIGIMDLDQTLEEAREYVERGFTILKIKTGLDLEGDIERVLKVREDFGPSVRIRVDANQGYSARDFARFFKQTKDCVEFSEQPLKSDQLKEMQALDRSMRMLSAADESLHTPADVPALLQEPRPFGIFNIKLMKCGGMGPGLDIARLARLSGIDLMWGCMDESVVSIAAALHAALASPATRYLDLDGSLDLARDIVKGGFILENGNLRTTDQPGLGVTRI